MTTYLLLVLALFVVQTFSAALTHYGPLGVEPVAAGLGTRDDAATRTVISARLDRAKNNMLEALPVFLPLALLHIAQGNPSEVALNGALIFLTARVVYIGVYAAGVPVLRSLVWIVGHAGLGMMAFAL